MRASPLNTTALPSPIEVSSCESCEFPGILIHEGFTLADLKILTMTLGQFCETGISVVGGDIQNPGATLGAHQ